jgi:hypothetical protein
MGRQSSTLIDPAHGVGFMRTVTMLARGGNDAQFKWDSPAVENAARSGAEGSGAAERRPASFGKPWQSERKTRPHSQETETALGCCAQENRRSSACSVGEVEGSTPQKVNGFGSRFPQFLHRYFVFTQKIALTLIKQLFILSHVDG